MDFREKNYVQEPIKHYVQEQKVQYTTNNGKTTYIELGWQYVTPDEALKMRQNVNNIIFRDVFINQLKKLNSDFLNEQIAENIIKEIENVKANINGNQVVWEYLKGLRTIYWQKEKRSRNVTLIDEYNLDNNIYQVTDEFEYSNGKNTIRADLVFLINGVPILFIETKAPTKQTAINEALEQIRRYHSEGPKLMAVMQLYAITQAIKFYYSATWNTSEKSLFTWKSDFKRDFETLVKTFFSRENIVRLLLDYILFAKEDEVLKKVVLRPHQIRAVNKIVERAKDKNKKRGLIWHTQGSGKTYTMIVAAQKIIENPKFENPTVILLVDRNELESQLFLNIKAIGIEKVELAKTINHLKELLSADTRGLIVSMIHKFEGLQPNINERENIFVMVDEAHRSTSGKLGNYLLSALPNAKFIGFTGTPIDKSEHGKGTFVTFGKDDPPHGYLDKYSIGESIEDGTTVPLYYTLAPNELQVDKDTLEHEFWALAEADGVSDIETLNDILDRAVNLRNMLKNKDRIEKVTQFVVDHYKNNVEPLGYKAFLVAVDREACALYKDELDKHLPPEYSAVVYSSNYNDNTYLSKYHLSEDEEKQIRKKFRNPDSNPKILIVTEKLLTGFDAPVLYCMYLDKPMRDHVLLQAIARVNRPYEDKDNGNKKTCGLIVDFIGIFDNLEKALAFDSTDIEGIVNDIEVLREKFKQLIEEGEKEYISKFSNLSTNQQVPFILDYFRDIDRREAYYKFYKELNNIYEILSPDSFLGQYLDIYDDFTKIYLILYSNFILNDDFNYELRKKTAELVKQNTQNTDIGQIKEIYKLDANTLKKLDESDESDIEKIYNLNKRIQLLIQKSGLQMPFLISIGEKAQNLVESFNQRQKDTKETLEELKKMANEINASKKEQQEKKMSPEEFTIYRELKNYHIKEAEIIARKMGKYIAEHPYWKESNKSLIDFRQELYKSLSANQSDINKLRELVERIIKLLTHPEI